MIIYDPLKIDFSKPGKHHYQVAFHLDSSWGYSLVPLTVINGLNDGEAPGVVAFGGTHGNEWEGQVAIKRLCADLNPAEMRGRVILMPQLSESACRANTRISPLDGINMNRAFPGDPRGSISYRIADFVNRIIFPQVRVVLDIHSGGNEGGFPICSSFHPIPNLEQSAEMARVARLFDTPFIMIYSSDMAKGLLTDEAEAGGKITIGGEFGFGESVDRRGTLHAYEGIRNVLRHYHMLAGNIVKIDPARTTPPRFVNAANLDDYIPAPRSGIWEPLADLGSDVEEGQVIGRIHDFNDHTSPAAEMYAHRTGVLLMMHFPARIEKGVTAYVIGREIEFL